MSSQKKSTTGKKSGLLSKLEVFDQFGHPISLTYNGDSSFRSPFGGIMTVFWQIAIAVYFVMSANTVLNRGGTTVSIQNNKKNLGDVKESPMLDLTTDNFNFGMNIQYAGDADPASTSWFNQSEIDRYFMLYFG